MSVQALNHPLVDLLRPFFWHKNDSLPGGGCPWKLCAPDGDPDPAFWVDNSGDAFAVDDLWISKSGELGLDPAGGRFGFYENSGSVADDLVILWDADFRLWEGRFTADEEAIFNGNVDFNWTVYFGDHVDFYGPTTVWDDWAFDDGAVFSEIFTLNDDAATNKALSGYGKGFGVMFLWALSQTYSALYAIAVYGVVTTAFVTSISAGADVVLSSGTGTLTGTTGADDKFNILFSTNGGRVYFENRMGAQRQFAVAFWACNVNTVT